MKFPLPSVVQNGRLAYLLFGEVTDRDMRGDVKASKRSQANKVLSENIKRIFDDEKERAGSPRITRRLQSEGISASHNRVAKIMRENGWRAKAAKKYKATTNSNHSLSVAPNLLEQNFEADGPDQKWVSDITYIWTEEGWLYLAVVLEPSSRRVGWAMGRTHDSGAGMRCA